MDKQTSVIIYHSYIAPIGGIETWIYNLCEHLHSLYDIVVLYDNADSDQIERLSKYVDVIKRIESSTYHADVLINATNWLKRPRNISFDKNIAVIHCDYDYFMDKMDLKLWEDVDEFVCVSQSCSDSLLRAFGEPGVVIDNILGYKKRANKILHLSSFTRLTEEKGWNRMQILAQRFIDAGIKFEWKVFSTIHMSTDIPGFIFMDQTLDIYDYICDSDYVVQLSDTESFCYSIHEALQYGVPVIVTDIPIFHDLIEDGVNGYKVPLDMNSLDIDSIYNHIPTKFEYNQDFESIKSKWFDIIGKPIKNKSKARHLVKVQAIADYYDLQLKRKKIFGDKFEVSPNRAIELVNAGVCSYC